MKLPFFRPSPPPVGVFDGQPFPHGEANFWSKLTLGWVSPIFKLALGRSMEQNDPWEVQPDAACRHAAEEILEAHQPRIPPSRRMEGYRSPVHNTLQTGRRSTVPVDRAIIFDRPSTRDSYEDRRYITPTLVESAHNCQLLLDQLDTALRSSRPPTQVSLSSTRPATQHTTSNRRKTLFEPFRNLVTVYEEDEDLPSDSAVADKLTSSGGQVQSKDELIKVLGRRKARQVLAGKLALEDGKTYDMSVIRACYIANRKGFWMSSGMLLLGFAIRMAIPLLTRAIIDDIVGYQARLTGDQAANSRSMGATIGITIAFLVMLMLCNMLTIHSARIGALLGSKTRAALIYMISKKSMQLSSKSRHKFSTGKINSLITADAGFAEMAYTEAGLIVMCPPVIIIGCALIINTIGVAGLAGVGVIALTAPIQKMLFSAMIKYRMNHLTALDSRTQLLTETVRHLHAIKLFAYGPLFEKRISDLRMQEAKWVKKMSIVFALADIIGQCLPAVAAVVTFTIFTAMGNNLTLSQAFAVLQFFNFIQQPLTWAPRIFSNLANILNASRRLQELFIAEERASDINIIPQARYAIRVDADFCHEAALFDAKDTSPSTRKRDKVRAKIAGLLKSKDEEEGADLDSLAEVKTNSDASSIVSSDAFRLASVLLRIPHGSLVCVVGRVGSGKTTLLSGLLGETKTVTGGSVEFGGSVAYVPQEPWVQSGSIRHNIVFSADGNERRLRTVIKACGLTEDLARLADGVETSVGERGISLSGGQKSRVCLARAAYSDAPIVLLDDPLSAVDAQVGHALLNDCILNGPLAKRTRVLVTHHLNVLPRADIILVLKSDGSVGRVAQQGSYSDLMRKSGSFRTLMQEYGSKASSANIRKQDQPAASHRRSTIHQEEAEKKAGVALELEEERESGSVALGTYLFWLRSMGSLILPILLAAAYILSTAVSIAQILWLAFWQSDQFAGLSQGAYQVIYAGIAVAYAATGAICNIALIVLVVRASIKACLRAVARVMGSPTSFLDRTPSGRIVNRLTKDIEQMDTSLAFLLNRVLNAFTQPANRDVKRTDAVVRSKIYANFAEQLNGLAVIRAFRKVPNFETQLERSVDHQNRFTYLRQYMLAWLSIRVAMVVFLPPFGVALYGVIQRETVNAAQLAVSLTFILQSSFVPMLAMLEQDMNSVERVKHYCHLEQDALATKPTDPPKKQWPTRGAISFRNVHLRYRDDLPLVLKGLSFDVRAGERVGIIGRTGAGKSSLVQSIYRTVELAAGSICIDDINLRDLGLDTIRSRLSLIPQEAFLFEGTVSPAASESIRDKFRLDTEVQADGSNFSAGEKQLLSLIRALVRRCRVLILDEATSSVDPETDALIQRLIQTEFSNITLLSIAHRLQTVAYYDRILVMDAGRVAEYDSPLRLFDNPSSVFRSLCDVKGISRQDILAIQAQATRVKHVSRAR